MNENRDKRNPDEVRALDYKVGLSPGGSSSSTARLIPSAKLLEQAKLLLVGRFRKCQRVAVAILDAKLHLAVLHRLQRPNDPDLVFDPLEELPHVDRRI